MDNEAWGRKLCSEYERRTGKNRRGIRLPAQHKIRFDGGPGRVTVKMEQQAVTANLQTNSAAFEAWSLALRVWCEVDRVELKWCEFSRDGCTPTQWRHYQRFLYRAYHVCRLFPDWFSLTLPRLLGHAEALGDGHFYLNSPGDRAPLALDNGERARELKSEA